MNSCRAPNCTVGCSINGTLNPRWNLIDLELRAADSGANVLLMRPLSDSVFDRTREVSALRVSHSAK